MPMKLQELHPSLVHVPLAMLPFAVGADLIGRLTGNRTLLECGRIGMAIAAGGAAVSAAAGLMAQQEVKAEGHALDMLITHRNINLTAVGVATGMAVRRWDQEEPGAGYLALGLASLAAVAYSAYLGGHMVYAHGVGVEAAGGIRDEGIPSLTRGELGVAARTAGRDLVDGAKTTVQETREGKLAPMFTSNGQRDGGEEGARA